MSEILDAGMNKLQDTIDGGVEDLTKVRITPVTWFFDKFGHLRSNIIKKSLGVYTTVTVIVFMVFVVLLNPHANIVLAEKTYDENLNIVPAVIYEGSLLDYYIEHDIHYTKGFLVLADNLKYTYVVLEDTIFVKYGVVSNTWSFITTVAKENGYEFPTIDPINKVYYKELEESMFFEVMIFVKLFGLIFILLSWYQSYAQSELVLAQLHEKYYIPKWALLYFWNRDKKLYIYTKKYKGANTAFSRPTELRNMTEAVFKIDDHIYSEVRTIKVGDIRFNERTWMVSYKFEIHYVLGYVDSPPIELVAKQIPTTSIVKIISFIKFTLFMFWLFCSAILWTVIIQVMQEEAISGIRMTTLEWITLNFIAMSWGVISVIVFEKGFLSSLFSKLKNKIIKKVNYGKSLKEKDVIFDKVNRKNELLNLIAGAQDELVELDGKVEELEQEKFQLEDEKKELEKEEKNIDDLDNL